MSKRIKLEIKEEQKEVEELLRDERIENSDVKEELKEENKCDIKIEVPAELGDSVLYCIGGRVSRPLIRQSEPDPSISYLSNSLTTPLWTTISWPHPRVYPGTVIHNHKIYIFGGFKNVVYSILPDGRKSLDVRQQVHLNIIEVFDLRAKTWMPVCKLPEGMAGMAVCSFDDHIYMWGGSRESNNQIGIYGGFWRYCPVNNHLERKAQSIRRSGASPKILLKLDRYLYAISALKSHKSSGASEAGHGTDYAKPFMERYDPITDQWIELAPLKAAHRELSAVVHLGKIYSLSFEGLEVYSPVADKWTQLAEIPAKRIDHGYLASINGRLITVGNYVTTASRKVFEFDFETAVWIRRADMDRDRKGHSVVVFEPSV